MKIPLPKDEVRIPKPLGASRLLVAEVSMPGGKPARAVFAEMRQGEGVPMAWDWDLRKWRVCDPEPAKLASHLFERGDDYAFLQIGKVHCRAKIVGKIENV